MRESQKRIKEYQERLPRLKEKVAAVLLLLALSASMLVTVSFAWVSISTSPEVTGVNTSIASNGNLEIALANGTLDEYYAPGASQVGDSNKETLERNITWGNLINLADPAYGLENLVLRPALLNTFGLVNNPLYGPVYDETGRVIDMNTNFGYSKWVEQAGRFESTDELGIRAITSMTYGEDSDASLYSEKLNKINAANSRAQTNYQNMAYNKDYMDALASMMTGYMVQNILKVNSSAGGMISDATLYKSDLQQLAAMYRTLMESYIEFSGVFASLLNLQAELNGKTISITGEEIMALPYDTSAKTAYNALLTKGFETYADNIKTIGFVKSIDQFLYDYNILVNDVVRIDNLISSIGNSVSWPKSPTVEGTSIRVIDDIIDNLVNVRECTITGGEYNNLKIKSVGATAALALKDAGTCETKITNGVLYNFDNITGARIRNPEGVPLKMTVQAMGTQTITSNVSTSANDNYYSHESDRVKDIIVTKFSEPELIANDTYGFAVDLWVRTNAANTFLTLQGNVLTQEETIDVKGKDLNGDEVQLYTISVKAQSDDTSDTSGSVLDDYVMISHDIYESTYTDENGTEHECYRYADNHSIVTTANLGIAEEGTEPSSNKADLPTPNKKVSTIDVVIGFEGDNRIWEGDQHSLLSVNSTTQGSGSCYVFYAETPVDQQRSLELLKSMKVAFVDANGTLLATAFMDSDRHYANSGKVIVPMVLDNESTVIGQDDDGNNRYAITGLEQNVATRITAIVYLDGTDLTNEDVLAAADIEGHMNIQFGSSAALYPLNNETLYNSELIAEMVSISPDSFDYDTLAEGEKMESTVKVRITGDQPSKVTANFIRRVNATQGSPEGAFELKDTDGDGVWEGTCEFLYPGEYIIRSVTLDGVERDLLVASESDFPKVTVKGFTISSVTYRNIEAFVMTDANSVSGNVEVKFASDDPNKMPKSVIGKFIRDDGAAVNINFSYDATTSLWKGVAKFVSSGEYSMQFLILDGQYVELPVAMQKDIELILGMRVNVGTTSPTRMSTVDAPAVLNVQVDILDNNGDIIPNLYGASIVYSASATNTMHSSLEWNIEKEYYEAELTPAAGTFSFGYVNVKMGEIENVIRSHNSDAPVFSIIPPTPPSYVRNSGDDINFNMVTLANTTTKAAVTVTLKDAPAAKVYAKFIKIDENGNAVADAEPLYVYQAGSDEDTGENETFFVFYLPSGLWQLESVSAFDVYDSDGNGHILTEYPDTITEEDYIQGIIFSAENDTADIPFTELKKAVLYEEDIKVSLDYAGASDLVDKNNSTVILGKNSDGSLKDTALFMSNQNLNNGGITVTFSDDYGLIKNGYFTINNVSYSYKYGSTSDAYGGYTSNSWQSLGGTTFDTFTFTADATGKCVLNNADQVTFQYAAKYTPDTLDYTVSSQYNPSISKDKDTTLSGAYSIEVWSKEPTVTITAVSPNTTTSIPTKITWTKNWRGALSYTLTDNKTNKLDTTKNEVTVYAKATTESDGESVGTGDAGFARPKLTFTASGIDSSTKVTFTIPKGNSTNDIIVSLTGTTSGEYTLGNTAEVYSSWSLATYSVRGYFGHGDQTISTVTFTKNSIEYKVTLDKPIVIHNPSSVNKTS